jgi:spermidine/putrescine transport system substrate-binding protein
VTQHEQAELGVNDLSAENDPSPLEPGQGLTRRHFIGKSGGAILAVGGIGSFVAASNAYGSRDSNQVVVLTWGDPATATLLQAEFKKQTGINLVFVPGVNSADFFNKVVTGGSGQYDVVTSNVGYVPLYVQRKLIEPLDLRRFSNAAELHPSFRTDRRWKKWYLIKPADLVWAMPRLWGTYSMTYRVDFVQPTYPISWREMWNVPKGKAMTNVTPNQMIAYAGRLNGVPWNKVMSMQGADLEAAVQRLRKLKPFSLLTSEADQITSFVAGESWIGQVFGLGFAARVNAQAGSHICKSVIPLEGAFGSLSGSMLLKGARNRANALRYINFSAGRKSQLIYWQQYHSPLVNRVATKMILAKGGPDAKNMLDQRANDFKLAAGLIQQQTPADQTAWTHAWDEVLAG